MSGSSDGYKIWLKDHRARQTALVRTEQKRVARAAKLLASYRSSMLKLGLRPLDRFEIADRGRELRTMLDAARQISDTPELRSDFEKTRIHRSPD